MSKRYKLHPISAVINFVKGLKDLVIPFAVILFANGFNGDWWSLFPYLFIVLALVFSLVTGIIKWKRFVYWFEEDELRIESGLFVKNKRYIPFERIQSLNYTEGILHRPFKLVKVDIETAGTNLSNKSEAELTAITREAADVIEREMAAAKRRKVNGDLEVLEDEQADEAELTALKSEKFYKMSLKELLVLASTSSGIGVIFSGIAVVFSQFSEFIPYDFIYEELKTFIQFGVFMVALAVFLVLLVAWIVSVGMTLLNYYDFSIAKEEDQLYITRGLLEKKKITLPMKRIQGVRIVENPLRQLFGYASVIVDSAGGSITDQQKINLFPLIKKAEVKPLLESILPDYDFQGELESVPERSKPYFYRIDFVWMIPIIVLAGYFFYPYGLFSLLLIPIGIAWGLWQHRAAGFTLLDQQAIFQFRVFSKHTYFLKRRRIQSLEVNQSYFQKRRDLATIQANIKSGSLGASAVVPHMNAEDAGRILDWYEPGTK
ncbi:PH domain-containing protein [Chungangia koreensis]|uniref:PH domain-containing protein n=1 Tax=Chungangia koreensis TaxID=752657 RepID=A0ABV8X8T1_9LACT